MDRLLLVTGGSRSGKSRYAQQAAELLPHPRVFIATCQVCDVEMAERVTRHRQARNEAEWISVEEPRDLAGALLRARDANVILVDCLTLWVNNLLYEAHRGGKPIGEEEITAACHRALAAANTVRGAVILVTGEVGMGIVPDNPLSRLYRDCVGTCNQIMAAAADAVTLVASGLPLTLKG